MSIGVGQSGSVIQPVVGTWKLVSAWSKAVDGETTEPTYGTDPAGLLTYTADGRVSVVISHGGRRPLSIRGGKLEEQAEAFNTFLAYAGRYTTTGDSIIHHVEVSSIQNYVGKDLVRTATFDDDRMTLITPPTAVNGKAQVIRLTWQRLPGAF